MSKPYIYNKAEINRLVATCLGWTSIQVLSKKSTITGSRKMVGVSPNLTLDEQCSDSSIREIPDYCNAQREEFTKVLSHLESLGYTFKRDTRFIDNPSKDIVKRRQEPLIVCYTVIFTKDSKPKIIKARTLAMAVCLALLEIKASHCFLNLGDYTNTRLEY